MVMVMGVALVVNVLLLYAAGKWTQGTTGILRVLLAAGLGALLTGLTAVSDSAFLAHWLWRLAILLMTGVLAFGIRPGAWGNILLFALLHTSLSGVSQSGGTGSVLLGAAGIGLACLILGKQRTLIPVELDYAGQTLHLMALRDTGNTLRDPITGKSVLVVGADTAAKLTGLSPQELSDPLTTIEMVPGLRLIPYQTVGDSGFLLAIWIPKVKIGGKQGSAVVALSPRIFESHYQALTGGMV